MLEQHLNSLTVLAETSEESREDGTGYQEGGITINGKTT